MHHGLATALEHASQTPTSPSLPSQPTQHGLERSRPSLPDSNALAFEHGGPPRSGHVDGGASQPPGDVDIKKLDEKLRGLSCRDAQPRKVSLAGFAVAGQRISEYEQALTPLTPKGGHGVVAAAARASDASSAHVHLDGFPSEILVHIFSYLDPDSHSAVALVSKYLYAVVTTPHIWRVAFQRTFPGQDLTPRPSTCNTPQPDETVGRARVPQFARLTRLASWRSEYLLRTRLLQSVASGKPSASASASRKDGKKASAVITYNSQLPWMVTRLHAAFSASSKKPSRAVHGASELGTATASNPATGKLEPWAYRETYSASSPTDVFPRLQLYGLGAGPAAVPNVMDVSQLYGAVVGEGYPGGRAFARGMGDKTFHCLDVGPRLRDPDLDQDIPNVPVDADAISSMWMAKSPAVPTTTKSVVGILTGSTLGVVSAYSFGKADSAAQFPDKTVTVRWMLSPGVPIIAITADDSYSEKRKTLGRVWAVALNALGEVYYLQQAPMATTTPASGSGERIRERLAWQAGRTARWQLIPSTQRSVVSSRVNLRNKREALAASPSPRSSFDATGLSQDQWLDETRLMNEFLLLEPSHFRAVYDGWDMRQRLEVDFAGSGTNMGEMAIVVIRLGGEPEKVPPAAVTRYTKMADVPVSAETLYADDEGTTDGWQATTFSLTAGDAEKTEDAESAENADKPVELTCSAIDLSLYALLAPFEDPLLEASYDGAYAGNGVPGRRARWLAVGTKTGSVVVWNMREPAGVRSAVRPVRLIQTESPEVTSVAVSALYLVHGGSDGMVQAWDPLTSTLDLSRTLSPRSGLEPVRTLNARSARRMPRHMANNRPDGTDRANFTAVGAIFLDPDPAALRGVLAMGPYLRSWSYSASAHGSANRKRQRRLRHANVEGQMASRRVGTQFRGRIAVEAAELRQEQADDARHQSWMRNRFGVGLGGLTEEEALRYAEMISAEAFQDEELQRSSGNSGNSGMSDNSSSADMASFSSGLSVNTVTPEPSMAGSNTSPPAGGASSTSLPSAVLPAPAVSGTGGDAGDDDFELQMQRAIRLSLMEGVNEGGGAGGSGSSGGLDFPVTYRPAKDKGKAAASTPVSAPVVSAASSPEAGSSRRAAAFASASSSVPAWSVSYADGTVDGAVNGIADDASADDELQRALQLSLQEEEERQRRAHQTPQQQIQEAEDARLAAALYAEEEFPALEVKGKGKGKWV